MSHDDAIEQNRRMWNETARIHERAALGELLERVRAPGFTTLDATEERIFAALGLGHGAPAVAQLSCNNARELLSVKLRGAGRCTGFDLSDAFIEQGRQLVAAAGVELELVRTSVFDIAPEYDGAYDIVYVTVGALGWLPDLPAFFAVAARLLRPGGALFIYEMHPLLDMLDPGTGFELKHSYFRTEPYVGVGEPDYVDPSQSVSQSYHWFHHRLADVFRGCLEHGLSIEAFEEYPHDVSTIFRHLEPARMLPLTYTLVARRA